MADLHFEDDNGPSYSLMEFTFVTSSIAISLLFDSFLAASPLIFTLGTTYAEKIRGAVAAAAKRTPFKKISISVDGTYKAFIITAKKRHTALN